MSAIQLTRCLKPQYQEQVDLVQAKPFKLVKWNLKERKNDWDDLEFDVEEVIARSKSVNGIRAYARLHKLDPSFNYTIYKETIEEFIEGWCPSYSEESVEDL